MKKVFFIFSFFLWIIASGTGEHQILNLTFLPAEYYVGDRVRMAFLVKHGSGDVLEVPDILPSSEWMRYLSVNMEETEKGTQVEIHLIPYYPGTRSLPPLTLGTVVLKELKIYTSSLLDGQADRDLAEIRGPLLIPGTRLMGIILIFLLFALPVVLVFLVRRLWSRAGNMLRSYRISLPYRRFQRIIRRIRGSMTTLPEKEFYSRFSSALKIYLSSRFQRDFFSATTSEIEVFMGEHQVWDSLVLSLVNLFHQVDRVKFAGDTMMFNDRKHLLEEAEQVSQALEEWRKENADL